jgi:hypothetical protein
MGAGTRTLAAISSEIDLVEPPRCPTWQSLDPAAGFAPLGPDAGDRPLGVRSVAVSYRRATGKLGSPRDGYADKHTASPRRASKVMNSRRRIALPSFVSMHFLPSILHARPVNCSR